MTVALVVLYAGMAMYEASFGTVDNFANMTRNFAPFGIMALGMTVVIITGGIDLSVGSIMGARGHRHRAVSHLGISLVRRLLHGPGGRAWLAAPSTVSSSPMWASRPSW